MWNYSYLHIEKNVTSYVVMKFSKVGSMTASEQPIFFLNSILLFNFLEILF